MKRRQIILFLLPFLVIAVGYGIAARRQALQEERNTRQQKFLNFRFSSVKRRDGYIVMTPTTNFSPSFNRQTPKALAVGNTFEFSDHHWHGTYRITSADSDGIIVRYDYNGSRPAYPGRWSGTVKIAWK